MSFEVHQPNISNMEQYLQNEKSKSKDFGENTTKWYSFPQGMCAVRILPPWDATGRVALPVYMHPIEYQGEGMKFKKYNWTCTEKTLGRTCQICEGLKRLAAAGVDVSKYEANRRKFYFNAIVIFDPTYNQDLQRGKKPEDCSGTAPGTHVILNAPKTIYDWIISQITNPMIGDITSLTNGIDIYVTKEGSGLGTKYTPTLSPNGRTAVPQEYLDKIENLYNLDEIFGAGFDQEQIDKMVQSLNNSASAISAQIPGVVSQMAGYGAPAANPYQQYAQPMATPPVSPYAAPQVAPGVPPMPQVAPSVPPVSPYAAPQTTGYPPVNNPVSTSVDDVPFTMNPTPTVGATGPESSNKPKCFGQYDPAQVTCVVCPEEINCMNTKRG